MPTEGKEFERYVVKTHVGPFTEAALLYSEHGWEERGAFKTHNDALIFATNVYSDRTAVKIVTEQFMYRVNLDTRTPKEASDE